MRTATEERFYAAVEALRRFPGNDAYCDRMIADYERKEAEHRRWMADAECRLGLRRPKEARRGYVVRAMGFGGLR